ncbi:LysR family transcriptional regulator (plasmid) [Polymorphobacter sp. PAMC 29334]|uniref:LysR family transcriptional regulator n=1 Tax=Polymorphobacter sp. PAMC 29334 TaxID=2862331 RepID=UPI001C682D68|nr:LysR family transcriptional regulator [Polymorphobacter sp. PAMC 29334]QYE37099.1 LysR family transcriptional regulator [Polymorphobacter sp. PAMC 29334]
MRKTISEKERFDVSLEDLQTFLTVADLRGFSRAAERLSLSRPSVSNRVRRLEDKLGVRLLDRTTRHVELTKDGLRLHARASVTLNGLKELLRDFDAEVGTKRLQIDVAATMMVTTIALPPVVQTFAGTHPRISVRLSDRSPAGAIADVAKHRVDMAILVAEDLPPELQFELLLADRCVVVTSLGHPLLKRGEATLAEVLGHPLLSPDGHVALRRAVQVEAEARGLTMDLAEPALGVSNAMTLLAMAAAGLGVLIHPPSLIPPEFLPTIGTLRLSDCDIVRSFGIVTAKDRTLSLPARAFRDHLLASVTAGSFGSEPT